MKGETCIRQKVEINGENYYVVVGKDFLHITCPRENAPDMRKERLAMELLVQTINKIKEGQGVRNNTMDTDDA